MGRGTLNVLTVLCLALLPGCAGERAARPAAETTDASATAAMTAATSPQRTRTSATTATTATSAPSATASGITLKAGPSDYGQVLFDATGQAVYVFDVETDSRPRCYGPCAEAWPPVLTHGGPRAASPVDASLLGTTRRRNGDVQVTVGGRPIYYYAHEGKRVVECHDIVLNGGTWYALQPNGEQAP